MKSQAPMENTTPSFDVSETIQELCNPIGTGQMFKKPFTKKMRCDFHNIDYDSKKVFGCWTGCPLCYDESQARRMQEDIKTVSSSEGIPWLSKRRQNMSLDTFNPRTHDQEKIFERVKKYVDNFKAVLKLGSCLMLYGPPGTGKTHLVTGVGVAIIKKGYSVHYERLYDLTRRIKATYAKGSTDSEKAIIDRLNEFDLLILDEVGLKEMSETEKALTYEIIDARYEDVKPTIIVSNLCEKELQDNLGERTIDRLYENHGVFLKFDGESVRKI